MSFSYVSFVGKADISGSAASVTVLLLVSLKVPLLVVFLKHTFMRRNSSALRATKLQNYAPR